MKPIEREKLMEWLFTETKYFDQLQHDSTIAGAVILRNSLIKKIKSGAFDVKPKRCDLCPDDEETCYCYEDKPVKEVSHETD